MSETELRITDSDLYISQKHMAAIEKILAHFPEPAYIVHDVPHLPLLQRTAFQYGWVLTYDFNHTGIHAIELYASFPIYRQHIPEENLAWLKAIAQYVKRGSYIEFLKDDCQLYRIVFTGKEAKTIYPIWKI